MKKAVLTFSNVPVDKTSDIWIIYNEPIVMLFIEGDVEFEVMDSGYTAESIYRPKDLHTVIITRAGNLKPADAKDEAIEIFSEYGKIKLAEYHREGIELKEGAGIILRGI